MTDVLIAKRMAEQYHAEKASLARPILLPIGKTMGRRTGTIRRTVQTLAYLERRRARNGGGLGHDFGGVRGGQFFGRFGCQAQAVKTTAKPRLVG
jgi:hypothetical protein